MRRALIFTWAAGIDLLLDAVLAGIWFGLIVTLLSTGLGLLPVLGIGALVFFAGASLTRLTGAAERLRANALLETAVPAPRRKKRTRTDLVGVLQQGWLDSTDVMTWRVLLHHLVSLVLGIVAVSVTLGGIGSALDLALGSSLVLPAAVADVNIALRLLLAIVTLAAVLAVIFLAGQLDRVAFAPLLGEPRGAALRRQITSVSGERQAAVDAASIERHRIERDLHDGAQPRLVSVAMTLGLAQAKWDSDPDEARRLIEKAHSDAKLAITDLRQLARGIHPAVLTDRGLDAALSAIASRCPVPTTVQVALERRPSAEIEAVVYFTIAESLTNVAKHSGATACQVSVSSAAGRLVASVADNGRGGARLGDEPLRGAPSGLDGIVARVRSAGGTVTLTSPTGGPTRLVMELPCAS